MHFVFYKIIPAKLNWYVLKKDPSFLRYVLLKLYITSSVLTLFIKIVIYFEKLYDKCVALHQEEFNARTTM